MRTNPFLIEVGKSKITGVVQLFELDSCTRYVGEAMGTGGSFEAAAERLMMRHLVSLEVDGVAAGAIDKAKAKCPSIAQRISDLLAEEAGFPVRMPAMKATDDLDDATPPFVLAAAGLDRASADKLLAEFDGAQRIVRITDRSRATIFAAVVRAPDQHEGQLLSSARAKSKGVPAALLSLARSCVTWSRDELEGSIARYPAIPLLSLVDEWDSLGGASAEARFC